MKKYYEDVINILATKIFNKISKYCEKNEVDLGKSLGIFINRLVKLSPNNIYIQKKDNINFEEKCKSETYIKKCKNCGKIIYKQSPEEIPLCDDCIHLFFKEFNNPENGNLTIKKFREKISKPKNLKSITSTCEINKKI